jgi:hypothetical protein
VGSLLLLKNFQPQTVLIIADRNPLSRLLRVGGGMNVRHIRCSGGKSAGPCLAIPMPTSSNRSLRGVGPLS